MFLIVKYWKQPKCPPIEALDKIFIQHITHPKKEILYVVLWNDIIEILNEKVITMCRVRYALCKS